MAAGSVDMAATNPTRSIGGGWVERSDSGAPPGPGLRRGCDKHHICAAQRAFLSLGHARGSGALVHLADNHGIGRMHDRAPGGQARALRGANGALDALAGRLRERQPRAWRSIARIHGFERPT
jgi:hypothetical protein